MQDSATTIKEEGSLESEQSIIVFDRAERLAKVCVWKYFRFRGILCYGYMIPFAVIKERKSARASARACTRARAIARARASARASAFTRACARARARTCVRARART